MTVNTNTQIRYVICIGAVIVGLSILEEFISKHPIRGVNNRPKPPNSHKEDDDVVGSSWGWLAMGIARGVTLVARALAPAARAVAPAARAAARVGTRAAGAASRAPGQVSARTRAVVRNAADRARIGRRLRNERAQLIRNAERRLLQQRREQIVGRPYISTRYPPRPGVLEGNGQLYERYDAFRGNRIFCPDCPHIQYSTIDLNTYWGSAIPDLDLLNGPMEAATWITNDINTYQEFGMARLLPMFIDGDEAVRRAITVGYPAVVDAIEADLWPLSSTFGAGASSSSSVAPEASLGASLLAQTFFPNSPPPPPADDSPPPPPPPKIKIAKKDPFVALLPEPDHHGPTKPYLPQHDPWGGMSQNSLPTNTKSKGGGGFAAAVGNALGGNSGFSGGKSGFSVNNGNHIKPDYSY